MPNDDDGQDHMFRFIQLKEVDRPATFGEVATPKVLHDMTIRQEMDRSMHALFAQFSEPCTETSPGLAVMISVDFDSDVVLRTQILAN